MGNFAFVHDSGAFYSAALAVAPQNASAAVNGASVDRLGKNSAKVVGLVGNVSGAPTSFSVEFKLQQSADGSTWSDVAGASASANAANSAVSLDVDLTSLSQYVRVVATPTFTGGTSPAADLAAALVLGGQDRLAGA